MKRNLLLIIFCISFYTLPLYPKTTSPIRMLILSGINNHKWQETTPVMQELERTGKSKPRYKWEETDTTLALLNRDKIIWQYNFRTKQGKPFFHPVTPGRNIITCLPTDDHPWHLGRICRFIHKVQPGFHGLQVHYTVGGR